MQNIGIKNKISISSQSPPWGVLSRMYSFCKLISESYTYDTTGNRTIGSLGSNTTSYTTNILDQYTNLSGSTNSGTFTYDNNGNLVNDGQKSYKYDYNNRLIEVNIGTGNLVKYTYDILGRRTKKIDYSKSTMNPESTVYVYNGDNILSEYKTYSILVNGTGTLTPITLKKNYINSIGTDGILAYDVEEQISPTGTGKTTNRYYYHTNQLGSVTALTNSTGAIIQTYSYDAFGKAYVRNGSGTGITLMSFDTYTGSTYSNSRLYTGREYDKEIGMYYLRARYYNANTGKFISRDPIGQNDQVNLYTYVANSPLKYVDRMGREKVLILIGTEKREGEFTDIAEYYRQKYLEKGIKDKNILIKHNISSASAFNNTTGKYQNNINSVIWITHASQNGLDASKSIDNNNINEIDLINVKPMCTNKGSITLVGCNAGGGANPIAAELSNQTGVPVTAANFFILPTVKGISTSDNLFQKTIDTIGANILYGSMRIAHEKGEPTFLFGVGSWKTFNPN